MNLFKKVERGLSVLAVAPLVGIEHRERERKLEERLKRSRKKYNSN
jgi:hypothetical protein